MQIFKRHYNTGEVGNPIRPVQQIEIEMVSPETGEAGLASPFNAVSRNMTGPDFGNQEYTIALAGNGTVDQSLSVAVAIYFRRVD